MHYFCAKILCLYIHTNIHIGRDSLTYTYHSKLFAKIGILVRWNMRLTYMSHHEIAEVVHILICQQIQMNNQMLAPNLVRVLIPSSKHLNACIRSLFHTYLRWLRFGGILYDRPPCRIRNQRKCQFFCDFAVDLWPLFDVYGYEACWHNLILKFWYHNLLCLSLA